MKKILTTIIMCMLLPVAVQGQNPVRISTDTLPCGERQRNYFYSEWYDTTDFYLHPDDYHYTAPDCTVTGVDLGGSGRDGTIRWRQQFAPRRIRIKGLWAMVDQNSHDIIDDSTRLPEYLYIGMRVKDWPPERYNMEGFLDELDSVRWDTAQPKMMCMKQFADGRKRNLYCHVYEALFDTVYTLAGEFWIGGSNNSYKYYYDWATSQKHYEHWPTEYIYYGPMYYSPSYGTYPHPYRHKCHFLRTASVWSGYSVDMDYGPFGVILDEQQYYVELPSADTARGIAMPTAYYPAGSHQTVTAVANNCYRFSHWSDGDTSNPRTILVTQDTLFTAYFDSVAGIFDVAVRSNDTALGDAVLRERPVYPMGLPLLANPFYRIVKSSDTVYCDGDSAVFWARPKSGAYFWYWNDSVRENPRRLTVTQDTVLTAIFRHEVPPEYVPPCPRVGKPRVVVMDTGEVLLTWGWGTNTRHGRWEVAWGLAGMPPDSCEIIQCGNFERLFGSLEAGVRYAAYVRALCKHNDSLYYSDWSDSVEIYFPYFPHRYTVTVAADYEERGRVYGGGEYDEGDVAMLTANAWNPYRFLQWNDGDTANPRYVVVMQDTSFTALFSELEGIAVADSLSGQMLLQPNPARDGVRCVLYGGTKAGAVLTVSDAAGREVLRRELAPGTQVVTFSVAALPAGTYFVTLTTPAGTSTKKLVVE